VTISRLLTARKYWLQPDHDGGFPHERNLSPVSATSSIGSVVHSSGATSATKRRSFSTLVEKERLKRRFPSSSMTPSGSRDVSLGMTPGGGARYGCGEEVYEVVA